MSHRVPWIVLLVAAVFAVVPVPAAVLSADAARIREVTVYRDRAEVVREVRVDLPAGASTVRFGGIPVGVEADSLRVEARGVPAVLGAVEVREQADKPAETAEFVATRDDVRRLERAIAGHQADQQVDDELRRFLTSLQATTGETASRDLGDGRADPQAIAAVYELLAGRLAELAERRLDRQTAQTQLREELAVAQARLNTLRPAGNIRSRIATVELEAERAGTIALKLAYVVPGALWYPAYKATLDAATGKVNWVVEGVVRQNTGEDWTGVTLSLSTASPSQGVEPPFLTPSVLTPIVAAALSGNVDFDAMPVPGRFYQNTLALAPGVSAPAAEAEATVSEAVLQKSAYNVSFGVPGTSDIPADGRDHRVVLRTESLAGNVVHRTVPGMESQAYLTSVTTSPAGYPLLPGNVRVFTGGAYLGRFRLEETGPGVELTVPFGVDNRLEVIRVALPRSEGRQGLTGRHREIEYAYKTQLHNLQDRPVTLVLEDRLPVSEDERIVVELDVKRTTDGFRDSPRRPGVKLLTLDLAPGEKREVFFAYAVRHPKDLIVAGLD